MDEFMIRALLAGVGVALAAGPLGVFMVWRRMAYFGDTLSHSALLGVTLAVLTGLQMNLAILLVSAALALIIAWLQDHPTLPADTALGILAHGALALGLVAVTLAGGVRLDLLGYLFGDVLATSWREVGLIFGGAAVVLGVMARLWRPLLNLTVHEGMARVDGVPVKRVRIAYMLLVALTVSVALKIVGALLITALLIIPAATARPLSRTPLMMALLATAIGIASVLLGLAASLTWDTPSGPSIVLAAGGMFVGSMAARRTGG